MDWNALTASANVVSTIAIVAGGAIAIYQLREGRRVAQFDATERMVERMLDPDFNRALRFVLDELPKRLIDPAFTAELTTSRGWDIDPERHPELIVLARLQEIGIYLRRRLVLGDALLDFNAELILQCWEHLREVVDLMRTAHRNPKLWSNAEYLYERAKNARSRAGK